jgi:ABC-type xylose transport system permease subunit
MKTENKKHQTIIERFKSATPPFFKKLRTAGLILAAAGGVLIAAPIAIPAALVTVGGYLVIAGTVATAVSQAAVDGTEK